MSTGKRLAKRSILGTRVACCLPDGKFYPAVIVDVRSRSPEDLRSSVYKVRVEGERKIHEVSESELVGSGFSPVSAIKLRSGQKVYVTHNNREVSASVVSHTPETDEVILMLAGTETPPSPPEEVHKRLEEVRLLESRKSARLADSDTDFAKLADVATDRKRPPGGPSSGRSSPATGHQPANVGTSSNIDVPGSSPIPMGSRKRRSSRCGEEDTMDECAAALVLMKLSCSPRSALLSEALVTYDVAGNASSTSSSGVWSWAPHHNSPYSPHHNSPLSPHHNVGRSATPSPPLSDPSPAPTDDGIELDDSSGHEDESAPRKRRGSGTWAGGVAPGLGEWHLGWGSGTWAGGVSPGLGECHLGWGSVTWAGGASAGPIDRQRECRLLDRWVEEVPTEYGKCHLDSQSAGSQSREVPHGRATWQSRSHLDRASASCWNVGGI
ncbi:zinc finger protein 395-like [Hyalella azteca]|uniref:Zinc finger protein 395-like n=1 Tax=Hyalella azteca TaxID=294128 RepID=A0A979FPZ9_HYAAZ|nr:zinc finger protein 395-like [Hyalella azteca]